MSNIGRSLKGITIQLGADVTKLQTALKQVNTNIRNTQSQLKDVERLLRLDPTNTELLAQKQRLLKQAVSDTKDKLDTLKKASEDAAKTKDKYDAWKVKYDPIKTKIDETTEKLKKLKEKSAEMERAGNIDTTAYQTLQREIEETSTDLKNLKQDAQKVSDEFGHPVSPEQYDALQREIIETEQDLESLQTQARNTSTSLETMAAHGEKMQQLGTNIKNVGQKMMPVTLAVTAVGTAAVKTSADFESSMSKVAAISGATGDDLEALTAKAREMGAKTKFSASEAADGLQYMAMAGWTPQQMLEGLDGVMNLAAASGEDLATTSDIVTDALTAFGLEAEDSSHFADVLAAASSNANTNVSMMGETFKYVAPVAGALGYSVEDTATIIGVLANNGIKSSQAGTVLRKSINSLVAPSKKATTQMQKLGFYASETIDTFDQQKIDDQMLKVQKASNNAEKAQLAYNSAVSKYGEDSAEAEAALNTYSIKQQELATAEKKLDVLKKGEVQTIYTYNKAIQNEDGSLKSFSETIDFLRENLNGLSDAEKTAAVSQIFGAQASSGILAILKTSEKDYDKLTNAIENCDGKTQEMAETMQDNLSGQFTILKSQLQELAISFGEVLLPKIKKLVSWLQGVVDKLNKMTPQTRGLIAAIALIVASIGPLLIVIGTLIGAVGSAMVNFKKLHGFIKGFPGIMTKLSGIFSKVGTAISGISAPVLIAVAVIAVLVAAFKHLWDTNEGFRNKMIAIWDGIVAKIQSFVATVKEKFSALGIDFNTVVECLKGIWDAFCNFLAPIFEGAFQLISDALSAVLDVIVGILDVFIGIFTGNWEQAWEGLKTIFVSLWDFIVNTLKNVLNTLKNAADSILQEWGTSWDEFWTMIKDFYVGIWNNIVDFFTGIIQAISDKILEIWNAITGFFTGIWNTITGVMNSIFTTVSEVWNAIYTFFEPLLTALSYLFETIWMAIKIIVHDVITAIHDKIVEIWTAIYEFIEPFLIAIQTIFETVWGAISSAVSTALNAIKTTVETIWNAIKAFIEPILNAIKTTVSNIWNSIKTSISTKMQAIKNTLFTVWESVKTGIANKVNGIKEKIVNGFKSAVDYVKGLINQAKSWGTDLIQNIINGLHEKIQALADGVTDVANTIRDFLHFSVPDRGPLTDFQSWMPDFMQGMAQGIERSRGLIQKAISHVSGDMVITPTANAALIGGGTMAAAVSNTTTNNSNVTYNFNQTNNSPKALSRFDIYRQSKNLLSGVKGR